MLYYASVSPKDKVTRGGGVISEGEDIRTLIVRVDEALKKIETGEIRDAKSIIGLQWLYIQRLTQ
jgi:soluble cytochrome b562